MQVKNITNLGNTIPLMTGLEGNICFLTRILMFFDKVEGNIEIQGKTKLFLKGPVIECFVM